MNKVEKTTIKGLGLEINPHEDFPSQKRKVNNLTQLEVEKVTSSPRESSNGQMSIKSKKGKNFRAKRRSLGDPKSNNKIKHVSLMTKQLDPQNQI